MKTLIAALFALFVTGCASMQAVSGVVPPPDTTMSATWPATLRQAPATRLALGPVRIRFGRTTLQDVLKAVGVGKLEHSGDAGDSRTWLCYVTAPHDGHVSRLWLVSGEIDSGKYITGVSARRVSSGTRATASCPQLPASFDHIVLDNDVWLGVSKSELAGRLKEPSHVSGDWRMFDYTRMFKADSCEEAQRDSSLWVRLRDGRVEEIHAYQTETC